MYQYLVLHGCIDVLLSDHVTALTCRHACCALHEAHAVRACMHAHMTCLTTCLHASLTQRGQQSAMKRQRGADMDGHQQQNKT